MNLSPRAMTLIGVANAMLIFFISNAPQLHNADGSLVVAPLWMLMLGTVAAGIAFLQALTNGGTGTKSRETMALALPPTADVPMLDAAMNAKLNPADVARATHNGATADHIAEKIAQGTNP